MFPQDLLSSPSLDDIKRGYRFCEGRREYCCLICSQVFVRGRIYSFDDVLLDAEAAVEAHIAKEHGSVFDYLLQLDKKYTGLTGLQRELLTHFHNGATDDEIMAALDIGSRSTIRNHRFALREREKHARVFLAIMELLGERLAAADATADRAVETGERLTLMPRKQKKRQAVIECAAARFTPGRRYDRLEVKQILESVCEDYVTLRRCLVDGRYIDREPDGSYYWVRETAPREGKAMDKKEARLQYKNTLRPAGVYQIRNNANGKILIGSSLNLDGSRNRFEFEQKTGCISKNTALRRDWDSHGPDSFSFEILEQLKDDETPETDRRAALTDLEQKWLDKLQPYDEHGYNRKPKTEKG